jgi:hypothetical protein
MGLELPHDVTGNAARILDVFLPVKDLPDCFWFRTHGAPKMHGKDQRIASWMIVKNPARSKPWDEFAQPDAPNLDFVFTVCDNAAKEVCPVWPGQPMTAHWGLPDPANAEGNEAEKAAAFADTMRMLNQRIGIFVSLPLDKLSKMALQKHLDDIGKVKAETESV